jgi:cysteine desulfurase
MVIYLDHNATTPLRREVRARWLEALDRFEGNASSLHGPGRRARDELDRSREQVAAALGVHEDEVLFTSGGTEANNLALLGTMRAHSRARLVTTAVEHSSVLGPAARLEAEGREVVRVGVDRRGLPAFDELLERASAARGDRAPTVVSVMAANNEVGVCPPLDRLGPALREVAGSRVVLHTDAVQALGRCPLDLRGWGIDLATFSAHKLGGPVGVGVLYRRRGVRVEPVMTGGGQEHELRPGTENVPAIVATALAIELAIAEREEFARRADELARALWSGVSRAVPALELLGPPLSPEGSAAHPDGTRLPGTLNLVAPHVDGKVLVTRLDLEGLCVSAGSACASGSLEPSHVLLAMGLDSERARAGLRISIGRATTPREIQQAVEILRRTLG